MAESLEHVLETRNIIKTFGGVIALNDVSFKLRKGEILGLVGDNGAGKTTLIKVISGVYAPDSGEIYFEGKKVTIQNPFDAKELGIETVYQNLALVDKLDVTANIFLGREILYNNVISEFFRIMNFNKMFKESENLLKKLGVNINNLHRPMLAYSGGQRQAVALSKTLYWRRKVAILDEPTAALGVNESQNALQLIRTLKNHGLSIIIISHNLQHVFNIVDRIMVLRRGEMVGIRNAHEVTAADIVKMITGAEVIEKI